MNKKKVLIIDDEEFIIDLVRDILSLEDIDCVSAENFNDGYKVFTNEDCDLVLADKNIENSSLEEFILKVKGSDKKVPIVLVTGERGVGDEEVIRSGVDEVVYKPFKMDEFLDTIKGMMEIK